jgi:precorrin-2 C(20)-methyltransferase
MSGKFYGVSVGPGDSELITLKAVRVLKTCDVIAVPRTRGKNTMALDIINKELDLSGRDIRFYDFRMKRDGNEQTHRNIAADIKSVLDSGKSVAMLSIGDISIYSTFGYILEYIKSEGYEYEIVPGVPSFCAAAARVGEQLTLKDKPLIIIPAGYGIESLDCNGTKVIMKSGSELKPVIDELKSRGIEAAVVQSCGLPDENVAFVDKSTVKGEIRADYFTTILVKD